MSYDQKNQGRINRSFLQTQSSKVLEIKLEKVRGDKLPDDNKKLARKAAQEFTQLEL